MADLSVLHLRHDGELTTRELAERVMCERGLDAKDATLRNSVVFKVVPSLRHAARRKIVIMVEKRKGMCIWSAGPPLRCALPIALPEAADRCGETVTDQGINDR